MAIPPHQSGVIIQGGPRLVAPQLEAGSPSVYVNGIAIYYSPWDFSLMFLRGLPSESPAERTENGELRFDVNYRIAEGVVMSPQHAKAMLAALAKNIEEYEAEHGEIPVVEPRSAADAVASSRPPAGTDTSL
jgi:Protein of unknown function (DUF3467)